PWRDLRERRAGKIIFEGWYIQYLFGRDESGDYLDYLAEHRMMWGREHVRLYENGTREVLPVEPGILMVSSDPEENSRLREEYSSEANRIDEMLRGKGFV